MSITYAAKVSAEALAGGFKEATGLDPRRCVSHYPDRLSQDCNAQNGSSDCKLTWQASRLNAKATIALRGP
jgi:hypothetical protein